MAERGDSLRISTTTNFSRRLDKFSSSRFYQMTYIGVPLIVGGLIVKRENPTAVPNVINTLLFSFILSLLNSKLYHNKVRIQVKYVL